jgi:flavin-binding protein dodecin
MAVLKVIEIMADSDKSWEDAARAAVKQASRSVNNIKSVWIKDQSCAVDSKGKVTSFRVATKITFEIDP